ncbi:MAG: hypothetical protein LBN34_06150 [Clostridiales Family XIII bacterium]|jgi:hypothetical protein|nr:hypothetical protein [Clostridiales Family XIII bacterium]
MKTSSITPLCILIGVIAGTIFSLVNISLGTPLLKQMAIIIQSFIFFIPIFWFVSSFGSILKHFEWKLSGYDAMPIILYPIIFFCDGKNKSKIMLDPFLVASLIFPPKYELNSTSKSHFQDVKSIEIEVFTVEIALFTIFIVAFYNYEFYILLASSVIGMCVFFIYSIINQPMHGQLTVIKNLENEKGFLYYANYRILFDNITRDEVLRFKCFTEEQNPPNHSEFLILQTWKYIITMTCVNNDILSPETEKYIEHEYVKAFTLDRFYFGRDEIELVKMYMYYGMITGDIKKTNMAAYALHNMGHVKNSVSTKMQNNFDLYWLIGTKKKYGTIDASGHKIKLFKRDWPYMIFENYRNLVFSIENKIKKICDV